VESLSAISVHPFSNPGRCYGLLIAIRGQAYVLGATERGFFYRFKAPIYSPKRGRFDSCFALRTAIGGIELLFTKWIRNEVLSIHFRDNWLRGYIDISRHGLHSFQLFATDYELCPETRSNGSEFYPQIEPERIHSNEQEWN
jgi:hypothetical protein